ncbi:MAG: DinB family protein [Chloroflexi bacterium]|nr:DinB family protein [Chloroflexota bacterium]
MLGPTLAWALRQLHERLETLVADVGNDQLAWPPFPGAHSLAFGLWHIARCDDNYLRAHIQGRPEVWQEEEWFQRWGLDPESTGMLLSDEDASTVPLPPKDDILSYARRVWEEVEAFVANLESRGLSQAVSYVERTAGLSIGQVYMTHIYGHDNRHMGEMEYIKGLMGLRGSVTL